MRRVVWLSRRWSGCLSSRERTCSSLGQSPRNSGQCAHLPALTRLDGGGRFVVCSTLFLVAREERFRKQAVRIVGGDDRAM